MAGRKIEVEIIGDASSLKKAFNSTENSAQKFGKSMAKAGKMAAIGLGVGVAAAAVVLKKSVDAALEAEKAQTRLDAAFKATSASAKERVLGMQQVNRVSQQAALDDEDLMDTLGRLTRVTGDVSKAQQGMAVAANLARGRGIELEAATKIVEKAYLGNVGALKRIGIEIPKVTAAQDALKKANKNATAEQIKAAKAADDTATRQSAIAALQKQYAGAAEAYGKTAAGAQDRFRVAVENLQESLGAKLLPALAKVAGGAATFIEKFSKAKGLEAKVKVVLETGQALLTNVAKIAVDIGKQLQTSLGKVDWTAAGIKIAGGIGTAFAKGLPVVGQLAGTLTAALTKAIQGQNWLEIGRQLGIGLKRGIKDGAKQFIKEGGQDVVEAAANPMGLVANKLGGEVGDALAKSFGRSAEKGIVTEKQVAALAMKQGWDPAIANAVLSGQRIGAGLATGTAAGIAQNAYLVAQEAALMVNHAYSAASKAGQMHSPSRLMMGLGKDFTQGFINGLKSLNASLGREMNAIINQLAKITERRAAQERQAAVNDAVAALAQARKKKEGVVAAEQALARAREDVVVAGLEKALAREQSAYDKRQALIQAKMDKLNAALQKAADKQAEILGKVRDKVLRAFDALRDDMKTPAEAALAALDESAKKRGLDKALADALASGDEEAILRAREDIQRDSLERQAATERKAFDQQTEDLRDKLGEKLEVWKGGTAGILKLLAGFGVDFASVGALLGTAFRDSLIAAVGGGGGGTASAATAKAVTNSSEALNKKYGLGAWAPSSIVTQVVLDGKVIAETVRKENSIYTTQNTGVRAI